MEGLCVSKQERCISNQYTVEKVEITAWFFMDVKGLGYSPDAVRCGNAECLWNACVCTWHLKNSHRGVPAEWFVKQGGEHKYTCRSR